MQKMLFYWSYFIHKALFNWIEVKRPRVGMFLYELRYSLMKFIDYESQIPSPAAIVEIETRFGRFRIRPGTSDMVNTSPAFERRDVNYLLALLARLLERDMNVLFLDIGADIGTFSVIAGNRFKNNPRMRIMAFEPSTSNFSLLKENVRDLNGLKAELVNTALWSEDGLEMDFGFNPGMPGTSGLIKSSGGAHEKVITRKLDSVLEDCIHSFDAFVLKMDVEGAEEEILKGAGSLIGSGKEIHILIEDFVRPEIVDYLEKTGARFITKLTPYNSFWEYNGVIMQSETFREEKRVLPLRAGTPAPVSRNS
ncbi:MAG: FkbM family methyltransferase [Nitrospiraceae bacterium]|nr:FkbM family methyltransferase [Nitrospiraceae bacterium]